MSVRVRDRASRITVAAGVVGLVVAAVGAFGTGIAGAHVTVTPMSAQARQPATLAFQVPNEAGGIHADHIAAGGATIRLEIVLPSDHPIPGVTPQSPPGWNAQVRSDGGFVRSVVWTGGRITGTSIERFRISTGPLPADTDRLVFRAIQTYDIGVEVDWDDAAVNAAPEPVNPAPVVFVTGGTASNPASTTTSSSSDSGISTGVVIGAVALLVLAVAVALFLVRRRPQTRPRPRRVARRTRSRR